MTESAAGKPDEPQSKDRRSVLLTLGIALNAIAGGAGGGADRRLPPLARRKRERMLRVAGLGRRWALSTPSPRGRRGWPPSATRSPVPGTAPPADIPCWVRRTAADQFQVFAINCAHLGCPVRWFPQSSLFMCPCHGGAYYADGARASGPPPRGLFQYEYKIEDDQLWIRAGMMPTPGRYWTSAIGAIAGRKPCA